MNSKFFSDSPSILLTPGLVMNNQIANTTPQYLLMRSTTRGICHSLHSILSTTICSSFFHLAFPLSKIPLLNSVPSMAHKVHVSRPLAARLSACPTALCYKVCIARYSLISSFLVKLTVFTLIGFMVQWCKSLSSPMSTTQQAGVYLEWGVTA